VSPNLIKEKEVLLAEVLPLTIELLAIELVTNLTLTLDVSVTSTKH